MTRGLIALRAISGILFLIQLTLGILFWTAHALSLVPLHMLLGLLFVISLLTLAVLAARAGAPRAPVIVLAALAVAILALGYTQTRLVQGPTHWVIRVVHLALAMAAMPIAGRLPAMVPSSRAAGGGDGSRGRHEGAGSMPRAL
jgi:hypothetical protein